MQSGRSTVSLSHGLHHCACLVTSNWWEASGYATESECQRLAHDHWHDHVPSQWLQAGPQGPGSSGQGPGWAVAKLE